MKPTLRHFAEALTDPRVPAQEECGPPDDEVAPDHQQTRLGARQTRVPQLIRVLGYGWG
jgi:hypothetical protein